MLPGISAESWLPYLLGISLALFSSSPGFGETPTDTADEIMLRGEIVETGCFVIGNRHGPKHRQCAIACARAGQDLGILDQASGLLHVEIRDQREGTKLSTLLPYVAQNVEVRGRPFIRGGIRGIAIDGIRPLE